MGNQLALISICLFILLHEILYSKADVYLHNPRGSNNRLHGNKANRRNANRVFDSQNNAKGGYNVAEKSEKSEKTGSKESDWFNMKYYMSGAGKGKTILPIEWTNQHGCGHGDLNCNIVLQYMCQPTNITEKARILRNGENRGRPGYRNIKLKRPSMKEGIFNKFFRPNVVRNEPWEWYDKCAKRERNKGLFTADQNLKGNEAKYTRQNPNGNRYGYECPEERDYYPYWHPTDWTDIAVLANKEEDCEYYKAESFNTKPKGECMEKYPLKDRRAEDYEYMHYSKYNNKEACEENGGKWFLFHNYLEIIEGVSENDCKGDDRVWGKPYRSDEIGGKGEPDSWEKCLRTLPKLDCFKAPTSRTNHLGNGENILPLTYNWILPNFPSGQEQRCVLRIRYNISTNDYDTKNTFSSSNNNDSVISNDPDVNVGKGDSNKVPLQLAINTAQFGRTFQDRSHIFKIIPRKESFEDCTIHNLNVKGKRGNIVQTYPAVEYDFTPKNLEMKSSDCVHIQFAGSNKNPQGNAGEGRAGTDRSNLVAMKSPDVSYPYEDTTGTLFDKATVIDAPDDSDNITQTGADIAIAMATAGYFKTAAAVPSNFKVNGCNAQQAEQLDCYPPSYHGLLLKLRPGQYYYMCSRNNNFTNRNQKASIKVTNG